MKPKNGYNFKVYFLIILITMIISYFLFSVINKISISLAGLLTTIGGVLGALLIIIFAITSILDYLSDRGFVLLKFYSKRREQRIFDLIKSSAHEAICDKDPILLAKQDALLEKILDTMNLKSDQYNEIPLLYRKLQYTTIDVYNKSTYTDALKCLCVSNSILIDLSSTKSSDKKYPVNYYLNFVDFLCNNFLQNDNYNLETMARMIRFLILEYHVSKGAYQKPDSQVESKEYEIEKNMSKQNYKIAIPENGNLFLGLKVASLMKLNVVRFLNNESYKIGKYWYGDLDSNSKIIIVHDVLVTGDQIIAAIDRCKKMNVKNIEVYTLVERTDKFFNGRHKISKEKVTYNSLIQLDDDKIKSLLKEE